MSPDVATSFTIGSCSLKRDQINTKNGGKVFRHRRGNRDIGMREVSKCAIESNYETLKLFIANWLTFLLLFLDTKGHGEEGGGRVIRSAGRQPFDDDPAESGFERVLDTFAFLLLDSQGC